MIGEIASTKKSNRKRKEKLSVDSDDINTVQNLEVQTFC